MTTEISSDGDYELPPLTNPPFAQMEKVAQPDDVSDLDQVTQYTNKRRLQLAEALAPKIAQEDPKVISAYLKTLDGLDKSTATRRRLGIEEAAQQSAEEEAKAGADILKAIGRKLFQVEPGAVANRPIPSLDDSIPAPTLVPGETDIGVANMSYDSFTKGLPNADGE